MTIVNKRPPVKNRWRTSFFAIDRLNIHSFTGKRAIDIAFATTILVLCLPLYLTIILLIKISSPGPVFYIQTRVGRNYRLFDCIKFRTMIVDADVRLAAMMTASDTIAAEFETNFKLKHDPRITKIGKFLRKTSLDEFPQFVNVLKGEMSVVGPRPLVPDELVMYGEDIDRVLSVRPGLTGLWQVSGRNDLPYQQRIQLDLNYVKSRNLWLDLKIMFKTIGVMIFTQQNGAY
jgi:lipopolysaccharide/colanic/teichoic acid biosynthesis glycosyltransferase